MNGNHYVAITDSIQARNQLNLVGADPRGVEYMIPKSVFRTLKLKDISCKAANLIKQEMLSKGGEAAVSRSTINGEGRTDVLLSGTLKQYRLLVEKLKEQPLGLKTVAADIEAMLAAMEPGPRKVRLAQGKELELGSRTIVMGILNTTPDSFSDGGKYIKPQAALERAYQMIADGADIIDIGGASSRPGAKIAGADEEIRRIMPVVEKLAGRDILISIDTFRAEVARTALAAGVHLINDIGRLHMDNGMAEVLAQYQSAVVLMHNRMHLNQGTPYQDLMADIIIELEQSVEEAKVAGITAEQIIIDPGLGFGKNLPENLNIIKNLRSLQSIGLPILIGASRKSFIGQALGLEVEERMEASLAVLVMAIMNGAQIVRVHDVKESVRAARMTDKVMYNG
jgi:dihydropteroate synthase